MKNRNKTIHNFQTTFGNHPKRSKFYRNHNHLTTMNSADLVPIYWDEVLPGDTFNIKTNLLVRQNTMIKPVMDNSQIDITYFFVPTRIVWDDWKYFMGENPISAWADKTVYPMPQIVAPAGGFETGTIADYMGIPIKKSNLSVCSLPIRAYTLIFNEWWRDENLQQPSNLTVESVNTQGTNGKNQITDIQTGGYPAKSNKLHDYFTSALPAPQKGEAVKIALGSLAEIHAKPEQYDTTKDPATLMFTTITQGEASPLYYANTTNLNAAGLKTAGNEIPISQVKQNAQFTNLYADLSKATAITINEFRNAATLQQMLELDARGGTRYTEYIKSHFGIDSGDARQQRPEYLGGFTQSISINQVAQTSASTDNTKPLGTLGAWSHTMGQHSKTVNKTFTEHGYIIGIATIRYKHSYQQGIEKAWLRSSKYDFYDPIFANIGEQPILNAEIYAQGNDTDKGTFGFKEPWAEYRYKPNRISGQMRSQATTPLDYWHYGDNYNNLPTLSDAWIREDATNIDRTLAIKSTGTNSEPQYTTDFNFEIQVERPIPTYSIPGLKRI